MLVTSDELGNEEEGKGKDDPTIFLDCYCQWHAVMYACVRIMDTQKERLHDNE